MGELIKELVQGQGDTVDVAKEKHDKSSVNSEILAEKMETEEDNVSDKEGRQSEKERTRKEVEARMEVEARLVKLEHLVGEGWSSSTREEVRRQEFVHRENKESHQATYILRYGKHLVCLLISSLCHPSGPRMVSTSQLKILWEREEVGSAGRSWQYH